MILIMKAGEVSPPLRPRERVLRFPLYGAANECARSAWMKKAPRRSADKGAQNEQRREGFSLSSARAAPVTPPPDR